MLRLLLWIVMALTGRAELIEGFNCLHVYDDVQVELNTHLVRDIRPHAFSPDHTSFVGSIEHASDSELFIQTVATGRRVTLQQGVALGHQIVWSPDSQFVFYTWMDDRGKFHATLATAQGEVIDDNISDE